MDHALISIGKFKKFLFPPSILLQIIVNTQRNVHPMQSYSPTIIALHYYGKPLMVINVFKIIFS